MGRCRCSEPVERSVDKGLGGAGRAEQQHAEGRVGMPNTGPRVWEDGGLLVGATVRHWARASVCSRCRDALLPGSACLAAAGPVVTPLRACSSTSWGPCSTRPRRRRLRRASLARSGRAWANAGEERAGREPRRGDGARCVRATADACSRQAAETDRSFLPRLLAGRALPWKGRGGRQRCTRDSRARRVSAAALERASHQREGLYWPA